jgi:hypothetical protein
MGGEVDLPGRRLADLVERAVLDVDAQAAGEALAQVGVQQPLERGDGLLGPADDDPRERLLVEPAAGGLGDVLEMVVDVLVDRALVAGLRPAALVVLAVRVALDERDLLQRVAGAVQQWDRFCCSSTTRPARSTTERICDARARPVPYSRGSRFTNTLSTLPSPWWSARRRRRSGVTSLASMATSYPTGSGRCRASTSKTQKSRPISGTATL